MRYRGRQQPTATPVMTPISHICHMRKRLQTSRWFICNSTVTTLALADPRSYANAQSANYRQPRHIREKRQRRTVCIDYLAFHTHGTIPQYDSKLITVSLILVLCAIHRINRLASCAESSRLQLTPSVPQADTTGHPKFSPLRLIM